MIQSFLLILLLMLVPTGRVYSPATSFTAPRINKTTPVAVVQKTPQMQISDNKNAAPAPETSAVVSTLHRGGDGSAETPAAPLPLPNFNAMGCGTLDKASALYPDHAAEINALYANKCVCTGYGQFVRGYDKDTGAVVCGYVTGCPYGDSVPLGPECYKNCLNTNPQAATDPTVCYEGTGYTQ